MRYLNYTGIYIQWPGTYALQITGNNGCIAISSPILISGITNQLPPNSVSIYPNPSTCAWQLTIPAQLIGSVAEVFDATGQIVFQSQIHSLQSEIIIPTIATGVYELRITGLGYNVVRKLVKM